MRIVMISGEHHGLGLDLAKVLSKKLGWPVLDREEIVELAREAGVKMARLAVSIIKAPGPAEKLAREKQLYLDFLTQELCERSLQSEFIYHGRAGHLLLPGVSHRIRVGITSPRELRIERASNTLRMSKTAVASYLDQLDEDVGRWNRYVHRADGRDPEYLDLVLNLETISLSNAASLLSAAAELPDFQPTPVSTMRVDDLLLAARARQRLAHDERTRNSHPLVHAEAGELTVAYPPNEEDMSGDIPQVLSDLEGCRKLVCVMADSTILWVQERFDAEAAELHDITQLAQRWGAAVEMLRLIPEGAAPDDPDALALGSAQVERLAERAPAENGGVLDDDPMDDAEDGGVRRTQERLVDLGMSAGQATIYGGDEQIMERIRGRGQYALVVLGQLFLSRGEASQKRLTRELAMAIRDRLKAPVVTSDELRSRLLFGKAQALKLVGFIALVVLVYLAIFSFQVPILSFLGGPIHDNAQWLTSVAVALAVPVVAYLYGTVSGLLLKLLNID